MNERPVCHRAEDLVTYLYGEAGAADAEDFHNHLQDCDACRSEFTVFNQVHDSIALWRDEALGQSPHRSPVLQPIVAQVGPVQSAPRTSALAALKAFFEVSPLWLRAATAFAAVVFCVMAVVLVTREFRQPTVVTANNSEVKYTKKDLDEAYEKGKAQTQSATATAPVQPEQVPAPQRVLTAVENRRQPKQVKPRGLTLREREQLAADLRLTPSMDDDERPFGISEQPNQ